MYKRLFQNSSTQNKQIKDRYWSNEAIRALKNKIYDFPEVTRSILLTIFGVHDYFISENRKIGQNTGIYFRLAENRFLGLTTIKKRKRVQKMVLAS